MTHFEHRIAELRRENFIADCQVVMVLIAMIAAFSLVLLSIKP